MSADWNQNTIFRHICYETIVQIIQNIIEGNLCFVTICRPINAVRNIVGETFYVFKPILGSTYYFDFVFQVNTKMVFTCFPKLRWKWNEWLTQIF